jgi:hypothetical protein
VKKKPASTAKIELDPEELKIPDKRTDFRYMDMKK